MQEKPTSDGAAFAQHIIHDLGPTFNINTNLLNIGNNIDVILGTPWLASFGCVTQDFPNIERQYVCNRQLFSFIDTTDAISEHLRQATLQQQELRIIAMTIADGAAAQAWSRDLGLPLFESQLYLPATSSLMSDPL
jgi:hypothetical protein